MRLQHLLFLLPVASCYTGSLLAGITEFDRQSLAEEAREESLLAVAPGGDGKPFWNAHSVRFIYAPAFGFEPVADALRYHFEAQNASDGKTYHFDAETPQAPLTPIWGQMPTGIVTLAVSAILPDAETAEQVGQRTFYKAAPFAGPYHEPVISYEEAAYQGLKAFCNHPQIRSWAETGEPHPDYVHYSYPSKMVAAIVDACVRYHRATTNPEQRELAIRIARGAADWMLEHTEAAGQPLQFFPHTYWGEKKAAAEFSSEIMLLYPAGVGDAYLRLYALVDDKRYLVAARRIAETYCTLQADDGSWPLKVFKETGKPVSGNRTVDIRIPLFLERMAEYQGMESFAIFAQRGIEFIETNAYRNFNWEGQFEDVHPTQPFENLTATHAALFLRWKLNGAAGSPHEIARGEDLLRWIEDQFIVWENPPAKLFRWSTENWMLPAGLEQYEWYLPIDAHSANFISTYLAAYRVTKKPQYLAKAISLANTLTIAQAEMTDALIPTYLTRPVKFEGSWLNCMVWAFAALGDLAHEVQGGEPKPAR